MKSFYKFLSLIVIVCLVMSIFQLVSFAEEADVTMSIDVSQIKNTITGKLYGVSTDWAITAIPVRLNVDKQVPETNVDLIKSMNEYKLPLVRIGEGATPSFDWSKAIGDYSQREEQTLWWESGKVAAGPVEYVTALEEIDPDVEFTFTLDVINQTAESSKNFVEFLVGDATTTYGAKRIEQGHADPVNVKVYELGNEPDYGSTALTVKDYISKCKEIIDEVKKVDEDAIFAVAADTEIYSGAMASNGKTLETESAWHRALLADAELMSNVSYIAVHTYYGYNDTYIDDVMSALETDISNSNYKDTKIYWSEHGLSNAIDTNNDSEYDSDPIAMEGVIETAFSLQRIMSHNKVDMATYHGIYSGEWSQIWVDSAGRTQLNGIGHLMKLFKEYGVGDLVSTTWSGYNVEENSESLGVAVKDANGSINVIMTNDSASAKTVDFSFTNGAVDGYRLIRESKIVSANANRKDILSSDTKGITVNHYSYTEDIACDMYTLPAYSVCALKFEPQKIIAGEYDSEVVYEEGFDNYKDYQLPLDFAMQTSNGLSYVEDGTLVIEADDWWKPQFVSIDAAKGISRKGLVLEADMTLIQQDDSARSYGARNKAGFAFVEGEQISTGALLTFAAQGEFSERDGSTQANITYGDTNNFMDKQMTHLKLVFSDETKSPDLYVNGEKVSYYNADSFNTGSGTPCLMVQAATVKFDNIKVNGVRTIGYAEDELVSTEVPFEYNEDFSSSSDLPEGWTLYCGNNNTETTAVIKDGALSFTSTSWFDYNFILFDLDQVQRLGLEMECDITYVDNATTGEKNNSQAGFVFAASVNNNSVSGSRAGIRTDIEGPSTFQEGYVTDLGMENINFAAKADNMSNGVEVEKINLGSNKTMKFKISSVSEIGTPLIYLNGNEVKYYRGWNTEDETIKSGKIGLYVRNANVLIDNIKIKGTRIVKTPPDRENTLQITDVEYDSDQKSLNINIETEIMDPEMWTSPSVLISVFNRDSERLRKTKITEINLLDEQKLEMSLSMDGLDTYDVNNDMIKVFLWDMSELKPLCAGAMK